MEWFSVSESNKGKKKTYLSGTLPDSVIFSKKIHIELGPFFLGEGSDLSRSTHDGVLARGSLYMLLIYMGVSENSGFSPQIIHGLIGFSIIFTIHFGCFSPIFGNTHIQVGMIPYIA